MKTYSAFLILFVLIACTRAKEESSPELKKIKGGDIVMRRGNGFWSDQIVNILKEERAISHCGLVLSINGHLQIIHSIDKPNPNPSIEIISLNKFIKASKNERIWVSRPLEGKYADDIQDVALSYLDQGILFDFEFDNQTKDKLHCSEFLHDVLERAVGKDIYPETKFKNGATNYGFAALFDENYFHEVQL